MNNLTKNYSIFFSDADWKQQQRTHPTSYNFIGNSTRIRSSKVSSAESNSILIDCVASRTRSHTPQNPQVYTQGYTNSFDSTLTTGYSLGSRRSYSNFSSSATLLNHPSTSKGGRG